MKTSEEVAEVRRLLALAAGVHIEHVFVEMRETRDEVQHAVVVVSRSLSSRELVGLIAGAWELAFELVATWPNESGKLLLSFREFENG